MESFEFDLDKALDELEKLDGIKNYLLQNIK